MMRKICLILIVFLFSFSLCGEARRLKDVPGEMFEYEILPHGTVSIQYKISPQGTVNINGITYQFLPVFSNYKLYKLPEGKFVVIGPNEELRFYFYPLKNPPSQQEVINVFKQGLLVPPGPEEDTLRFARHFLEHHTPEEVKKTLLKNPRNEWMASYVSENDWARLTSVANKFGLQRLERYFNKFYTIAITYAQDPEFLHKAASFLFLFQDPEIALRYIEEEFPSPAVGADPSQDIINANVRTIKQAYLIFTPESIKNLIAPIRDTLIARDISDLLKGAVDTLLKDISSGLRAIFYIVYEVEKEQLHSSSQNVLIPLQVMGVKLQSIQGDLKYFLNSLKMYFQQELVPVYRIINGSDNKFLEVKEANPDGFFTGKIFQVDHPVSSDTLPTRTEIVAVKTDEGYFLARMESNPPPQLRTMSEEERLSKRSFYIAKPSEHSTLGERFISATFRWQGDLEKSKTVFRFAGRNNTPKFSYHLRIDTSGNTEEFSLDLQSPNLRFLENIKDKYQKELGWKGHHFMLMNFTDWLRNYLQNHDPKDLKELLQNIFLLLAPEDPRDRIVVSLYIFANNLMAVV